MATVNPYAGDVIEFPAGTPAGAINAYYAAVLRNQAVKAQRYDPYYDAWENFQKQVLNPYVNQWLNQPFTDYRKTYDTNELMRQQAAQIQAQTAAEQQRLTDKFAQEQIMREHLGASAGGLLTQMEPQVSVTESGPPEPWGPYEDPGAGPPMFANQNPYAGAIAPEAVQVAQPVPGAAPFTPGDPYEAGLPINPAEAPTREAWWDDPRFNDANAPAPEDAAKYAGLTAISEQTGRRWKSDGTQWTSIPSPGDYVGPPPMPPEVTPEVTPTAAPVAGPPVAAPVTAAQPVAPVAAPTGPSRFTTITPTTPTLTDALRTLAGINPTQAGTMIEAIRNNANLAGIIDPGRQDLQEAKIREILARAGLTDVRAGDIGATQPGRVRGIEAGADLKTQQAEAVRLKNMVVAQASQDFLDKRIGSEELAVMIAAANGRAAKAGGKGEYPTDTKTFMTALTTVRLDPANAGKTEFELRELAQGWLEAQAQDIEDRKARGRETGTVHRPAAEQIARHTGYQQAADQLGEIGALLPKVRLEKITGGIAPWLNMVRQRGATQQWGVLPPITIPPEMREQLTQDEMTFLALTKDYADRVLRLRSGAQINDQEMVRMLEFLPTDASTPEAFIARFGTAFDDIDRWLMSFYRGSADYNHEVPEESLRMQIARRALKGGNKAYDPATVQKFLSNPANQTWVTDQMAPFRRKRK